MPAWSSWWQKKKSPVHLHYNQSATFESCIRTPKQQTLIKIPKQETSKSNYKNSWLLYFKFTPQNQTLFKSFFPNLPLNKTQGIKKVQKGFLIPNCLGIMPRFHSVWNLGKKAFLNMYSCGFFSLYFFLMAIYSNWIQSQPFLSGFFFTPSVWAPVLQICSKRALTGFFFLTIMSNGRMGILVSSPREAVWGVQDWGCFPGPQVCTPKYVTVARHLCLNPLPIWEVP